MNYSHNIYKVDDGYIGSAKEIAKRFDITLTAVYRAISLHKKTKGHYIELFKEVRNKEHKYEVFDGKNKIFVGTGGEIAKKFCVSPHTVKGAARKPTAKMLYKYTIKKIF